MSDTGEKKLSFAEEAAKEREQARKRELGDIEGRATLPLGNFYILTLTPGHTQLTAPQKKKRGTAPARSP